MATTIQVRRDTASNWTTANPVLAQGEPAFEIDTQKEKIGDGISDWISLEYINQIILEYGAIADPLADPNNIWDAFNAMDWTGHQYAIGSALSIQEDHIVTCGNGASIAYRWVGSKPVLVGLGGTYTTVEADFLATSTGDHTGLSNIGTKTHTEIDTHLADVANPHVVTAAQAGALPVAQSSYSQIADVAPAHTSTHTFDMALGDMQQVTAPAAGAFTLAFTGFVTGEVCTVIIDAVNWGDATVTYPVGMIFDSKAAPAFTAAGLDRLMIVKDKDEVYSLFVIGVDVGVV